MSVGRDIPIGLTGRVLEGERRGGQYLRVMDDRSGSTRGLYVLWSDDSEFGEGVFDDWVSGWTDLERYFDELGLRVEWQDRTPA